MIFEVKVTATIRLDTSDYKEMEEDTEEPTPKQVCELLTHEWDEGVLDIAELLDDPETLTINPNYA